MGTSDIKEPVIVQFGREEGLLIEHLDELTVGVEYLMIRTRDRTFGLHTVSEVGKDGKLVNLFRVGGETDYRLFWDYWVLKVI
jgi:hypothetical protein